MVIVVCSRMALTGVLRDLFSLPNIAGRYPSRPAARISRALVNVDPFDLNEQSWPAGQGENTTIQGTKTGHCHEDGKHDPTGWSKKRTTKIERNNITTTHCRLVEYYKI